MMILLLFLWLAAIIVHLLISQYISVGYHSNRMHGHVIYIIKSVHWYVRERSKSTLLSLPFFLLFLPKKSVSISTFLRLTCCYCCSLAFSTTSSTLHSTLSLARSLGRRFKWTSWFGFRLVQCTHYCLLCSTTNTHSHTFALCLLVFYFFIYFMYYILLFISC